ncbi:MAG: hypothetical protein NTV01_07315, partial [Bacteroidia bacterium]|nr:hypothetical protein [Bacteroidia bacterium]
MKSSGFHKLPILFFLSTLLFAGCEKPNTAPVADFSFSPASGAMDTLFTFDASGSSDTDDDISKLEVRWDWEADGVWDTDYSAVKTANHRFKDFADNYVILGVKDTKGLTASLKKPV